MRVQSSFAASATRSAGLCVIVLGSLAITGCTKYVTPGAGASFRDIGVDVPSPAAQAQDERRASQTDFSVQERLERKPLARFPAAIAIARVQSAGYSSFTERSHGFGAYSVVTTRTVEKDEHVRRLSGLEQVQGIAMLNRLVIPNRLESDKQLREAAAAVQADLLFIYTLDTVFDTGTTVPALGVITLGLFPNEKAKVTTTCAGVLMDTRNGYVYGLLEANHQTDALSNAWTSRDAIDKARKVTEQHAFDKMVEQFPGLWSGVVARYGPARAAASP